MMKITIVIPCYNSADTIGKVVDLTSKFLNELKGISYDFVLVNDYSKDQTYKKIEEISKSYKNVIGVNLDKNAGQHNAILAGLSIKESDYYLGMDDDMQTHPSQIEKLINKISEGYDVVYGKYTNTTSKGIKKITSNLHNYSVEKLIGKPKGLKATSFWIIKKKIRDKIILYPSQFTDLQSLFLRTTANITNVELEHFERISGSSNYTFRKSLKLWSSILNFSAQPFHYLMVVSIVIIILSIFFTLFFAFNRNNNYLLCLIASCIGLLLFSISLLGIYIVRMMFVITQTPQYMISEITEENID